MSGAGGDGMETLFFFFFLHGQGFGLGLNLEDTRNKDA